MIAHDSNSRSRRFIRSVALLTLGAAVLLAGAASAAILPPPPIPITLPAPASPNSFDVAVTYSSTGLLYAWNGAHVYQQNGVNVNGFTQLAGTIGSASSDPGPISFSSNGSQLLLGNGAGGNLGGANAGLLFTVPSTGGTASTPLATVPFHFSFLAGPAGAFDGKYFINQGTDAFGTGSQVSVFDPVGLTNKFVVQNIPGASASMTVGPGNTVYVGVGYLPGRGEIRSFALNDLINAYNNNSPLSWNSGVQFNALDNNSGAGLFFDARGFLFAGGPHGLTVFDTQGHSQLYENDGFSTFAAYDAVHDSIFISGFGVESGIYPASGFNPVPEPGSLLLAVLAAGLLVPCRRRLRRK